jgi:hypothetical protein
MTRTDEMTNLQARTRHRTTAQIAELCLQSAEDYHQHGRELPDNEVLHATYRGPFEARAAGLEQQSPLGQPCFMKFPWRKTQVPSVLSSERGFLEVAGGDAGMPLREAFLRFRDLVSADMDWADSRKVRFRKQASRTRIATLALTARLTVVLGIPAIPDRTSIALPMVALVTLLGGLEPYFNWRARWVLMEETQYRLNRIRDEMDYYLVITPEADISQDKLHDFFKAQQEVWSDVSRRWIEFRKLDQAQPTGRIPTGISNA